MKNETAAVADAQPRIVAWLGYGGLLPFITLAILTGANRARGVLWHDYLADYGAVILSFVGALHWGFAMALGSVVETRRNALFRWSVVPSLIAFVALVVHSVVGDVLLMTGFLLQYWQDRQLAAFARLPAWYLPLRLRLSVVAVICSASGAIFSRAIAGW